MSSVHHSAYERRLRTKEEVNSIQRKIYMAEEDLEILNVAINNISSGKLYIHTHTRTYTRAGKYTSSTEP